MIVTDVEVDLTATCARLLGTDVISVKRIAGGKNSRIYRVRSRDGSAYALKQYFRDERDARDRLDVEFSGLRFLWTHGVRCIPRPLAADPARGCAVYEYVQGRRIVPSGVGAREIDQAVAFLARLKELAGLPDSRALPDASEACLSVQAIVAQIQGRLARLLATPRNTTVERALHAFLRNEFIPGLDRIIDRGRAAPRAISWGADLAPRERTLSPSDFGFHNAIRRVDGEIVFVDFEYFGWDDPAKMICDFLLHPGMGLRPHLRRRFVRRVLGHFEGPQRLIDRMVLVYPLLGLKWCLIMLNEFVPEHLSRREFADGDVTPHRQAQQLRRARRRLQGIMRTSPRFPYDG